MMRKAAHDLADRAAVDAKVMGRPGLRPSKHFNRVKDVSCRFTVAGELVFTHEYSLSQNSDFELPGLKDALGRATLGLLSLARPASP